MAIEEQRQLVSTKTGEANANVDSINSSERTIQQTNKPNQKSEKSSTAPSSSPPSSQEEPPCVEKDMVLQGTQSVVIAPKIKGSLQKGRDLVDQKAKTTTKTQNLMKGKHTVPQPFSLSTDKRMYSREKKTSERPASSSRKEYANPLRTVQTHTSLRIERATELRRSGSTLIQSVVRTRASLKVETSDGRPKSAPKDKGRSERQTEATNMNKLGKSASFKAMPLPRFYSKKSASPNADALEKVKEEEKEVKKLQRSSTFRASPLPSFYHKKSPPRKPEFIKIPSTRAKSPNLLGPKSKSLANGMTTARPISCSAKETIKNLLEGPWKAPDDDKAAQSSMTSCGELEKAVVVSSAVKVDVIVSS